jgi:hypothetical protein
MNIGCVLWGYHDAGGDDDYDDDDDGVTPDVDSDNEMEVDAVAPKPHTAEINAGNVQLVKKKKTPINSSVGKEHSSRSLTSPTQPSNVQRSRSLTSPTQPSHIQHVPPQKPSKLASKDSPALSQRSNVSSPALTATLSQRKLKPVPLEMRAKMNNEIKERLTELRTKRKPRTYGQGWDEVVLTPEIMMDKPWTRLGCTAPEELRNPKAVKEWVDEEKKKIKNKEQAKINKNRF